MSLENDARECLLAAIEDKLHQALDAADLNTAKPSDPDFKCDFVRWRKVLDASCDCLRARGHRPRAPSNQKAKDLLDVTMSQSLGYLVGLASKKSSSRRAPVSAAAAATATAALFVTFVAIVIRVGRRNRDHRR